MIKIPTGLEISFDSNEIITKVDDNSVIRTKVEPRIMHVLQILINNSPRVVSREKLISEVWDNYGGADDALNQAISHLRKILNDTNKEDRIIETVVKKGYRFIGETKTVTVQKEGFPYILQKPKVLVIITLSIVVLLFLVFLYLSFFKDSRVPAAPIDSNPKVTAPAPDVDQD